MGRNGHRRGAPDDGRDFEPRGHYDDAGGETGYDEAYTDERFAASYGGDGDEYGETGGALVPLGDGDDRLPSTHVREAGAPVIIPGTGVAMGNPFVARRQRPLTMRLAMITLAACILVTGLFAVTPLGGADASGLNTFQALSGSLVFQHDVTFHWYTAVAGDSIDKIASRFGVQVGGIFELNNMVAGQELEIGRAYKIPDDPFYGRDYRPPSLARKGNGSTTFGDDWWNSIAGNPTPGAPCAPAGDLGNPTAYHLVAPNPGSYWVRGYSWFHNGIDLAAPYGNTVAAAQNGQVVFAGWTNTGFGYAVKINHCNHLSTLYGHNSQLLVQAGDFVHAGQPIALEGSTGWSTGPHLHYSVLWDNDFTDPCPFYAYNQGCGFNTTHLDGQFVTAQ